MTHTARETRLLETAAALLKGSPADETEVVLAEGRSYLTRFSRNRIHQNVGAEDVSAIVRVVRGNRLGVATASSLEPDALEATLGSAVAIADASQPVDDWPGLPGPRPVPELDGWDSETAEAGAAARADVAARIVHASAKQKGEAAGAVRTEDETLCVANSHGTAVAASTTHAEVNTVATLDDGSGYAEGVSRRLADLDGDRIGRTAARKAKTSRKPAAVEPGRYDVVLEPAATAEWIDYLAYIAFSGKDADEGQSPLAGKLGARVTGEAVTLWDNSLDPRTLPMAFDFEGQPKRRIALITKGVAKAVATNHYRARRLGKRRSTGHALPASSRYECFPMHLAMKGGGASRKRLIEATERGLLITRFHYTNILDPMKTVLTGMTRDGVWLIEQGEVVGPVRNLRYTENVLEALGRLDGLSRALTLVRGPVLAPCVRVRDVQFSGATEF